MRRRIGKFGPPIKTGVTVAAFAAVGFAMLHFGSAATLGVSQEAEAGALTGNQTVVAGTGASGGNAVQFGSGDNGAGTGLLRPYSMGFAPYAYLPYGDVSLAAFNSATGTKNFFAAFILGSGCTPLWDGSSSLGLGSSRSTTILNDINAVRAKGGDVAISFGGASGTELANACTNVGQLQSAYQSVIDKFALKHINFDLEGAGETNAAAMTRRVQASLALQQANPGLKVSLTLPVEPSGLDSDGLNVVKKFHDGGVAIASVGIMAMDFGDSSSAQSGRVTSAANGTINQMKQIYTGTSTAQLWKALNIIVMIGQNDTAEIFKMTDAQIVHDFAVQNGVGTLSMWSANRDQPCGSGASAADDNCSSISQTKYQFTTTMTIPAL